MNIEFTDLILSTVTVESKITNIKFKEMILIKEILATIEDNKELTDNVLKIGCNYGEYETEIYKELTKPKKKSNRGRKKKVKPPVTRKIQGTGKYFNSQITFTIQDKDTPTRFYHLKLFTNGTIQIPFVSDENIYSITYVIEKVIAVIKFYNVKDNEDEDIEISYIKSIMRNYKFNIVDTSLFIDLNKFRQVVLNFKTYAENDKHIDESDEYYLPDIDYSLYDKYFEELSAYPITLVKHSSEHYCGSITKFATPTESNPKKKSTVKSFSSGKINLDGCVDRDGAKIIQKILYRLIIISKDYILYRKMVDTFNTYDEVDIDTIDFTIDNTIKVNINDNKRKLLAIIARVKKNRLKLISN